jgi:hypothetical protein
MFADDSLKRRALRHGLQRPVRFKAVAHYWTGTAANISHDGQSSDGVSPRRNELYSVWMLAVKMVVRPTPSPELEPWDMGQDKG